jgi:hypothetical protein
MISLTLDEVDAKELLRAALTASAPVALPGERSAFPSTRCADPMRTRSSALR